MIKRVLLALILILAASFCYADNRQAIIAASGDTVIPAQADRLIVIKAIAVIATSTTSVEYKLYNEDNYLLGDASTSLVVDMDSGDGPAGFIMPYNDHGWFITDNANEAVKMYLSASTKVIVIVVYSYKRAY